MTGGNDRALTKRSWVHDNPYLLLALAALFWSGNHIVGRAIGGEVPLSAFRRCGGCCRLLRLGSSRTHTSGGIGR